MNTPLTKEELDAMRPCAEGENVIDLDHAELLRRARDKDPHAIIIVPPLQSTRDGKACLLYAILTARGHMLVNESEDNKKKLEEAHHG